MEALTADGRPPSPRGRRPRGGSESSPAERVAVDVEPVPTEPAERRAPVTMRFREGSQGLIGLPWETPLGEWPADAAEFVDLPIGSSRHTVRFIIAGRGIVALQGDRDFNEAALPIELFGVPTRLPTGPFLLARMTGARLYPTFIAYARDHRFEVTLEEPIEVARTDDREGDVRAAMERWARVLEGAIRRWPTQWYNFHDVWPEEAAPEGAER